LLFSQAIENDKIDGLKELPMDSIIYAYSRYTRQPYAALSNGAIEILQNALKLFPTLMVPYFADILRWANDVILNSNSVSC